MTLDRPKRADNALDDALARAIHEAVRMPSVIDSLCASLELQLRQQLGGAAVYIGKRGSREQLRERDRCIAEQFSGNNLDDLAKRYRLHPRHVRRILAPKAGPANAK